MSQRVACVLKLRPTCAQAATFNRWLWHLTGVYNWAIRECERQHAAGRRITRYDLQKLLKGHGRKIGLSQWVLEGTVEIAHLAHERWLKGLARKPRLKGRRRPLSVISYSHGPEPTAYARFSNGRFALPVIGSVRFFRQDIPAGRIGCMRLVRRASGWHLCLFIQGQPKTIERVGYGQVGIDPGFARLLTLSTGEIIERPSELQASSSRLAQAQRGRRGRLTARLHERVKNQRRNRNHHISRQLVAENILIAFSRDPTERIARTFGKSVASAAHSDLRAMLRCKSLTGGTRYLEVSSRNSTKTCSACGSSQDGPSGLAGLSIRTWTCRCGATWDRDINAARNTLRLGLELASEGRSDPALGIAS